MNLSASSHAYPGASVRTLHPAIHPAVERFLTRKNEIFQLVRAFGSPLNIIFPELFDENLQELQSVYKQHRLTGQIFFSSKPCKARSLLRQAAALASGVDISSASSLQRAVACGIPPASIQATGPKSFMHLMTCMQLDVLIAIDSFAELDAVLEIRNRLQLLHRTRLMVRLNGFKSDAARFTPQDNTFGIPASYLPEIITRLAAMRNGCDFIGFSFHSTRMNEQLRLAAIETLLDATFEATKRGLSPQALNIGGGFSIRYASSAQNFTAYLDTLKNSLMDKTGSLTWNKDGLGFKKVKNGIDGAPRFMEPYSVLAKGAELDQWLSLRSAKFGNARVSDIIRDFLLKLYIEPGRALVDQCGITLGRVNFNKHSEWGEQLVGLEMNQSHLNTAQMKQPTEPIVITHLSQPSQHGSDGVYYMGNLCLAYDILQFNKTFPQHMPHKNDVVAFINTAAYAMDFMESEALGHPLAEKLAVWEESSGFAWVRDDQYNPLSGARS